MSVNPELLDTVFEPTEPYLVGREKVREFASAVFATTPLHHDVDVAVAAGYPDVVAPPTFPIVIQEKTLQQLLSHEVIARLRVTKIQSLGGHTMVTSESTITTTDGEPVVVATSTLVIRGEEG